MVACCVWSIRCFSDTIADTWGASELANYGEYSETKHGRNLYLHENNSRPDDSKKMQMAKKRHY